MALGACTRGVKYALFTYNFLFFLTGSGMIGLGAWIICDEEFNNLVIGLNDLISGDAEAYILIVVGSAVAIISFCGCIGAISENRCLLLTFFSFMFIVFSLLLVGGIMINVTSKSVRETVTEQLDRSSSASKVGSKTSKLMMDFIQTKFNCCGETGAKGQGRSCPEDRPTKPACVDSIVEYYTKIQYIVSATVLSVAVLSLTGLALSAMLFLAVREQQIMKDRQQLVDDDDIKKSPDETAEPSSPSAQQPPPSPPPLNEEVEDETPNPVQEE